MQQTIVIPQIVVDQEGNLMLDSIDSRRSFGLTIGIHGKGEVEFTELSPAKAHCLGTVSPTTVDILTGDDGALAVVHQSQGSIDVTFTFEGGTKIELSVISGTEIGMMKVS